MKSKFISTGLPSAGRSLQAERNETSQAKPVSPAPSQPPVPVLPGANTDLDSLVRKEQARLQEELRQKERVEFHKHRQSLLPELRELIDRQQGSLLAMENQVETLIRVHEELAAASLPDSGDVSLTELRAAKRVLDTARLELIKIQRSQGAVPAVDTPSARGQAPVAAPLAGLTFKQATRLGFALSWPILAALLLGALFIGVCILVVFKG